MKKASIIEHKRPPYPIESVDNALRILYILRDEGAVRITDIAAKLDVAYSTAHRLMAMLMYRGFALQDDSRRYVAGPALGAQPIASAWTRTLREVTRPSLELLCSRLDETVNLTVRVGIHARVLMTIEATSVLRIGDRSGTVLPAHTTAGGRSLLAYEPMEQLERLYRGKGAELSGSYLGDADFAELLAELELTRRRGYAVCREEAQIGVAALAVPISISSGKPMATFSISVPMARLEALYVPEKMELIFHTQEEIIKILNATELDDAAGM
jgi:IclR family acetate operon transcriptional repressor